NALSDGVADTNWTMIATPTGLSNPPAAAYVTKSGSPGPVGSAWMPNTATSRWISRLADESAGDAVGLYIYRTTIDLTAYAPTSVGLIAKGAVDDELAAVRLNGAELGLTASGCTGFAVLAINGAFHVGVNTLDFVVNNTGASVN